MGMRRGNGESSRRYVQGSKRRKSHMVQYFRKVSSLKRTKQMEYLHDRLIEAYAIAKRYKAQHNEKQAQVWFKIAASIRRRMLEKE
jgi:hypothetical protein